MLYIYFPTNEEIAQGIFTGFMAWIGAIVGFYFGQKPVRDMISRLQEREQVISRKSDEAIESIQLVNRYRDLVIKTINEAKDLNIAEK